MEEHRGFFRLTNKGEIHATAASEELDVINISSSGVLVIKKKSNFSKRGILELQINNFTMNLHYQILRTIKDTMVLVFKIDEEINKLLVVLKKLRDEQKT